MEETRIVDVRREQGGTTYITAAGTYIKKTRNKFDFYSGDPRNPHDSIHISKNGDGSVRVTEKINGKTQYVTIPASMLE